LQSAVSQLCKEMVRENLYYSITMDL